MLHRHWRQRPADFGDERIVAENDMFDDVVPLVAPCQKTIEQTGRRSRGRIVEPFLLVEAVADAEDFFFRDIDEDI